MPLDRKWLLILAYVGCLSHPLFDWFNSYGIRLLEPFSSQWFYGDTLFIIDVWIWAALIAGVWLSLRRERQGQPNWKKPAILSLLAVCSYIVVNGLITGQAKSDARNQIIARYDSIASMPEPTVVANPVPVAFWQREIVWRDGHEYGSGHYAWARELFYREKFAHIIWGQEPLTEQSRFAWSSIRAAMRHRFYSGRECRF